MVTMYASICILTYRSFESENQMSIPSQINSAVTYFPDQKGFNVELRRRRSENGSDLFSLYGDDVNDVTFEVSYRTDKSLSIAVTNWIYKRAI